MHAPGFSDARLLIIDDTDANLQLMERILKRAGYTSVNTTADPTAAVSLYIRLQPDLIVLDLHMPGMDGFEVMEALNDVVPTNSFLPILVLTGDVDRDARDRALSTGAKDFLTKPFDPTELLLRIRNLLETRQLHQVLQNHNEHLENTVAERTGELRQALDTLKEAQSRLKESQEETVRRLSIAAELRDESTGAHIQRMSRYCALMARELGMESDECELLRLASQMHDVGKIGIPDSILLKPGPLTLKERAVMERHCDVGHRILMGSDAELVVMAATIAWTHHEKVDGTGYPRGLSGDDIPIEGRIAAVADVFDALTTERVYKHAFPVNTAVSILREGSGTHFDPELVETFLDSLPAATAILERFGDEIPVRIRFSEVGLR
ncbi:MAG TPA: HD domain-containing phosphohydrolase [Actinomycetota bacterium]|nr:HD domain-containing phosphohydrolase [Actinomycetota bacterium]